MWTNYQILRILVHWGLYCAIAVSLYFNLIILASIFGLFLLGWYLFTLFILCYFMRQGYERKLSNTEAPVFTSTVQRSVPKNSTLFF